MGFFFFFVFPLAFGLKVGWEFGANCRHVGCNYQFRVLVIRDLGWLDSEVACLTMRKEARLPRALTKAATPAP